MPANLILLVCMILSITWPGTLDFSHREESLQNLSLLPDFWEGKSG